MSTSPSNVIFSTIVYRALFRFRASMNLFTQAHRDSAKRAREGVGASSHSSLRCPLFCYSCRRRSTSRRETWATCRDETTSYPCCHPSPSSYRMAAPSRPHPRRRPPRPQPCASRSGDPRREPFWIQPRPPAPRPSPTLAQRWRSAPVQPPVVRNTCRVKCRVKSNVMVWACEGEGSEDESEEAMVKLSRGVGCERYFFSFLK